jgi:hypothetical protein
VEVVSVKVPVRAAGETVRRVEPLIVPEVAEIIELPTANATAAPPGLTLTIWAEALCHVAVELRSCVVPSEKVPIAVSWIVVPTGTDADGDFTVIDWRVAAATASRAEPVMVPAVAAITEVPTAMPRASPAESTFAMRGAALCHVTDVVMSWEEPSENVPVALSWAVAPTRMVVTDAPTAIETRLAGATVNVAAACALPLAAATTTEPQDFVLTMPV